MRRILLKTAPLGKQLAREFLVAHDIEKKDLAVCNREFLQMAVVPEDMQFMPDKLRDYLEVIYGHWVRTWVTRQHSRMYGKYAQLRDQIEESGVAFNVKYHRSHLAAQVIRGTDYSNLAINIEKLTRDALRIKKLKTDRNMFGIIVDTLADGVDLLPELYAQLREFFAGFHEVISNSFPVGEFESYGDLFRAFGIRESWRGVVNYRLPDSMKYAARKATRWLYKVDPENRTDNYDELALERLLSTYKIIAGAIQTYGYASTVLFISDLGDHYNFSKELRDDCLAVAWELLSYSPKRILAVEDKLPELIAQAREEYQQICAKNPKHATAMTNIFGS